MRTLIWCCGVIGILASYASGYAKAAHWHWLYTEVFGFIGSAFVMGLGFVALLAILRAKKLGTWKSS